MIENINLEVLKKEFNQFKKSDDYINRKSKSRFVEVAQLVIKELIKKDKISNKDLTSLIQIFGYNCKENTIIKYLKVLKFPEDKEKKIYNKFISLGETGYTGVGRSAIKGLTKKQLKEVHQLLVSVSRARTKYIIKKAVTTYIGKKIPQVGRGIFSPWLYYLKPQICPLMAGPIAKFFSDLGWGRRKDYSEFIDLYEELNKVTGENDLGFLDQFLQEEERRRKILISIIEPTQDSLMSLIENKKQIILYGPPGTGKTYRTQKIAVEIVEGLNIAKDSVKPDHALSPKMQTVDKQGDTILSKKIKSFIKTLPKIKERPRASMIGYYSHSKKTNKMIGLTWLEHPVIRTGVFRVHLRKENIDVYPKDMTNKLSNYKKNGWGGYPEFYINNENDANIAINLIKYANENL